MMPSAFSVRLAPHPDSAPPGDFAVHVRGWRDAQTLTLCYRLSGDLDRLRLPTPETPLAPDRLWAHTCLEAFWTPAVGGAYREYNFSPSGQWASFYFSAYRQRQADPVAPDAFAPGLLRWRRFFSSRALTCAVRLPLAPAPGVLALAAVLEARDGRLSYHALRHPPGVPDFHHPDHFALRLIPS